MVEGEIPGIEVRPMLDERGFVVVFDLWLGGTWIGSRRTAEQCAKWLTFLCERQIVPTAGTPW